MQTYADLSTVEPSAYKGLEDYLQKQGWDPATFVDGGFFGIPGVMHLNSLVYLVLQVLVQVTNFHCLVAELLGSYHVRHRRQGYLCDTLFVGSSQYTNHCTS